MNEETLQVSRAEVAHLHAFFHLLGQGCIAMGNALGKPDGEALPLNAIRRVEHDGERLYQLADSEVIIHHSTRGDIRIPRKDFAQAAAYLVERYRAAEAEQVDITGLHGFLDAIDIFDLQARTDDRTAFHIRLFHPSAPFLGVRLQSALGLWLPLLDGGRTANLKLEQGGVRFSQPAVQKINALGEEDGTADVARRMLYIESHGGTLRYNDVADRVFRANLLMLDTNLPRILCAMLRALHADGTNKVTDLVAIMQEQNPLKLKDELVRKHGFYRYKLRQLLLALAWGMRPTKQFTGAQSPLDAYLVIGPQGEPVLFTRQREQDFADYLLSHARLELASPQEAHYGFLERENGAYYFKLNLKIGLAKR